MLAALSSCLRCFLALFFAFGLFPALHAQSTEADLKGRLMNKSLYLRGCWRDDTLHFDSTGQLRGNSDPVTFTLSGFELKTLHLKRDKLVLEGRRVGLELRDNKQQRVPLNVGKVNDPEDEAMRIDIAASPSGDYGPALDTVFANGVAEFVPLLPSYWRDYAVKNFIPAAPSTAPATVATPGPVQSAGVRPTQNHGVSAAESSHQSCCMPRSQSSTMQHDGSGTAELP
jgi:hypothetical protein